MRQQLPFPGADRSEPGRVRATRLTTERIAMTQGARLESVKHEGIGRNRGERSWSCDFAQRCSTPSHGSSDASEGGADGGSEKNGPRLKVSQASTAKSSCQAGGALGETSGSEIGARQAGGQATRDCARGERATEGAGRAGGFAAAEAAGGSATSPRGGSRARWALTCAGSPTRHAGPPPAQAPGQGRDLRRG
jgi:hypothetical protein